MAVDLKPLGELELWNRPDAGEVAPWVRFVVAAGCALGVIAVAASAALLWRMGGHSVGLDRAWFHRAPPIYMLLLLAAVFVPGATVSRFVRLAVALPLVHSIAMVVALFWIPHLDIPELAGRSPIFEKVPPVPLFLAGLAITLVIARVIGGRRDWAHAFVMINLANLLLVGLWLPISSYLLSRPPVEENYFLSSWSPTLKMLRVSPLGPLAVTLAPPLVLATIYAVLSARAPAIALRARNVIAAGLVLLFGASVIARWRSAYGAFLIYDNFVHVVLVLVMLAITATVTLAIATWIASTRATRRLARERGVRGGVIVDQDDDIVSCLQIGSWLRGPRVWSRPFVVRSGEQELTIPGGVQLAAAAPLISSVMKTGEAVAVLRRGDNVALGGFVERDVGDDPFRTTRVTVPGASGIVVGKWPSTVRQWTPGTTPFQSMLLTAWRPSVAYLVILVAVGIPALVGIFVRPEY